MVKLSTLLLTILFAAPAIGQEIGQSFYRSGVDKILQANCQSKRTIQPKEVEMDVDNGYIRFNVVKDIYNPNFPEQRQRVKFIVVRDEGQYITVTARGFGTYRLSVPLKEHTYGKHYAILETNTCQSLIEYEYQVNQLAYATLYQCCARD